MPKIEEAAKILESLGLPRAQQNERCALTLLALANLGQRAKWKSAERPLLRTVDIMAFMRERYGKDYKPNSRETIRRQTLHQFEQARIVDRNPDDPTRPTNSGNTAYQLTEDAAAALRSFGSRNFDNVVVRFIERHGSSLLYIGDTALKHVVLDARELAKLYVPVTEHDKLPDIILYWPERNWLFLIEAVTSHGPVSPKRHREIEAMLKDCPADRVYVTAFPDAKTFRRYAGEIAWETEVWIADAPDHMIHFNGPKFLGPYKPN